MSTPIPPAPSPLWPVAAFLIALLPFLPALTLGFTGWDDGEYVTQCPQIQSFTWANIAFFLTNPYFSNYHPLTSFSYMVEHALWGLWPVGYHGVNLLLHGLNALLAYRLAHALLGRPAWALLAALAFALHPLRVEPVAWIASRKDLLCSAFTLASVLAYLRWQDTQRPRHYAACAGLFLLALLAKPMAVTLPLILAALDWLRHRWQLRRAALALLPLLFLSAVWAWVTLWAQRSGGAVRTDVPTDLLTKLRTASLGLVFYLGKFVWPVGLSPLYPYGVRRETLLPAYSAYAPVVLAVLVAVLVPLARRFRLVAFAGAWYAIGLLPVLQIVPIGSAYAADRYSYLPLLGPMIALAGVLGQWLDRVQPVARQAAIAFAIFVLVVWSVLSWRQTLVWRNAETLWTHAVAVHPTSQNAHNNLGAELLRQGRLDQALHHLNLALQLYPVYASAQTNRGTLHFQRGELLLALADFDRAIEIDPAYPLAHANRGAVLLQLRRTTESLAAYTRAIELAPNQPDNYLNRAYIHQLLGDIPSALDDQGRALQIHPRLPRAHADLANTLQSLGRYADAESSYNRALEIDPTYPPALLGRGILRRLTGRYELAIADLRAAQRQGPPNETLLVNLGLALAAIGRHEEAVSEYTRAADLSTTPSAPVLAFRGYSELQLGRLDQAIADLDRAISLDPNFAVAHMHRGRVEQAAGRPEAALPHLDAALAAQPNLAEARHLRAEILLALGDFDGAWSEVRTLRQSGQHINPDFLSKLQEASNTRE